MRILARLSLSLIVVLVSQYVGTAQTQPGQGSQGSQGSQGKGTVTGRVTVGGEPAAGVTIILRKVRAGTPGDPGVVGRAVTDPAGNYRITDVPPGSYSVISLDPALVPEVEQNSFPAGPTVTISSGETVDKLDLALVQGGVITGKVTDSDGIPLTGWYVEIRRVSAEGRPMGIFLQNRNGLLIDDRGIYRIFGLPGGHYRVMVGEQGLARSAPGSIQPPIPLTYHPSTPVVAEARIVEVERGSETTGVDIKVPPPVKTWTVAGRVVDAATGMGLSGVMLGYITRTDEGQRSSLSRSETTGKEGQFRLDGFPAGRLFLYGTSEALSEYYSETTPVEVKDGNVEGVVIRMRRGVNVSGRVVLKGVTDPAILARLSDIRLHVNVDAPLPRLPRIGPTSVEADGKFTAAGLMAGKAVINLDYLATLHGFHLLRVEYNGAVVEKHLELVPGKDVDGVQVFVGYGRGSIGGQVKVAGELPEGLFLTVVAQATTPGNVDNRGDGARVDARGRFLIEGLAPGEYRLSVNPISNGILPRLRVRPQTERQMATVSHGKIAEVTLTFEIIPVEQK